MSRELCFPGSNPGKCSVLFTNDFLGHASNLDRVASLTAVCRELSSWAVKLSVITNCFSLSISMNLLGNWG